VQRASAKRRAQRAFNKRSRLAFVGAGRLGSSLALAAAAAGYQVAALSTRRAEQREWLALHFPRSLVTADVAEAAQAGEIVFLCLSDRAIAEVCSQIDWRPGQAALHCAGAMPLAAIDHAARAGAVTGALHPLQTFPARDSIQRLAGVAFAVEASSPPLAAWARQFARDLGGVPFDLQAEHRAAYHASAVLTSGLLVPLVGLAAELWQGFGIPRERALASLLPLIAASVEALSQQGLPGALTGPFVRGDVATVRRHLDALGAARPDVARAYAALALAALPLAAEQGTLDAATHAELETMLRDALRATGS
jgi:predicted short-subunit dehydrogenase-like oxidoreductase (DUF2520 family)